MVDPAGAHGRRQARKAQQRPRGPKRQVVEPVGGDTFRQDVLAAHALDAASGTEVAAAGPTHDRALRAKLQQQYIKLTKRLGHPATRLPTLPDVQCLGDLVAKIPGGRARLIQFIQACMLDNDEQATAWWTVYADLTPDEREIVNLDEIGLVAGVPYWDLVGVVMRFGARYGTAIGDFAFKLLTVDAVVESAKNAKLPAEMGFPDRQMFLQGAGLVPSARGQTTQVTVNATAQAAAGEGAGRLRFLDDVAEAGEARDAVQQRRAQEIEGVLVGEV